MNTLHDSLRGLQRDVKEARAEINEGCIHTHIFIIPGLGCLLAKEYIVSAVETAGAKKRHKSKTDKQ